MRLAFDFDLQNDNLSSKTVRNNKKSAPQVPFLSSFPAHHLPEYSSPHPTGHFPSYIPLALPSPSLSHLSQPSRYSLEQAQYALLPRSEPLTQVPSEPKPIHFQ